MQSTTNYGLNKPEANDFYDVEHFNENMDILDKKIKGIEDEVTPISKGGTGKSTLVESKQNLGVPISIYGGSHIASENGWFKLFEVPSDAWNGYAIRMDVLPVNSINNLFAPVSLTLVLRATSTERNEPIIYVVGGNTSIFSKLYVVQNSDSITDTVEIWYKNTNAYGQIELLIYDLAHSMGTGNTLNNLIINSSSKTPLDSTTEGKEVFCFSDIIRENINADTLDGHDSTYFATQTEVTEIGNNTAENLFDTKTRFNRTIQGVTTSINDNGNGVINGTATAGTAIFLSGHAVGNYFIDVSDLEIGETVIFSVKKISGTYTQSSSHISNLYTDCRTVDNANLRGTYRNVCCELNGEIGSVVSSIFTMTEEAKNAGVYYLYPHIWVYEGDIFDNLELQIMVEYGSVAHDYVPYNLGREVIRKDLDNMVKCDAENLFVYPYYTDSNTLNGLTLDYADDGTITVNGTATARTQVTLAKSTEGGVPLDNGKYMFHCCPNGGSTASYVVRAYYTKDNTLLDGIGQDFGEGIPFEITDEHDGISVEIVFFSGVVCNNVVFKPIIEKGTVKHDFVPYNMSRDSFRKDIDNLETGVEELSETKSDINHTHKDLLFPATLDGERASSGTLSASASGYDIFVVDLTLVCDEITLSKSIIIADISIGKRDTFIFSDGDGIHFEEVAVTINETDFSTSGNCTYMKFDGTFKDYIPDVYVNKIYGFKKSDMVVGIEDGNEVEY